MMCLDRIAARGRRLPVWVAVALLAVSCGSCGKKGDDGADPKVTTLGTIEVTAKLVEVIPYDSKCTFPPNDNYDYVYIFKYRPLETHRGQVSGETILVGHYNPLKPRAEAADARAPGIGGNVTTFRAGDVHRMALAVPLEEQVMAGIINKYFGKDTSPLHWAVWTNRVTQ